MKKRLSIILIVSFLMSSCAWLKEDIDNNPDIDTEKESPQKLKNEEASNDRPIKNNKQSPKKEQVLKKEINTSSHYGILIEEQSLQIKKLRAELDFLNEELYQLKAQSQVWENPFAIYNKEIVLENGSTIYGKIIYQDQDIIKVETLIGGLTIDRGTIIKVTENVVEILPKDSLSVKTLKNFVKEGSIIETETSPANTQIERKGNKEKANLIVLGSIYEKTDENGNTMLSGEIKNIGLKRADFAKVNFLFRMNWRGDTKPMTCFVKGSIQDLGNGVISDASVDPESIGVFELFVPKGFGNFISYSYSLDWEQYE
ncbi:MAG: hypothetical protein CMG00_09255 [Candidatus Marinimicrobia bacterium]|nr:hypothetical protein [Candidatus Neomarinimicrobiota bacterium]